MLSSRARGHDARHLPGLVEHELGLGQVEVERAPLVAALAHQLGQLVHALEERHQGRELPAQLGVAVHDALHLLVRHARAAPDHAVVELGLADLALGVELEDRGLGQAVLALDEAADVAGERVRQHGHHAVGEVDGRAAEVGLLVERRAGPDVVRHVGDVHGELPAAAGQAVEADGVVVVARRLGVDGDGVPVAEVGAARDVLRAAPSSARAPPPRPPPAGRRRAGRTWP